MSEEWPKLPKVLSLPPRVLKREVREMYGVINETPNEFTPGPFGTLTATFLDGKEDRKGSAGYERNFRGCPVGRHYTCL